MQNDTALRQSRFIALLIGFALLGALTCTAAHAEDVLIRYRASAGVKPAVDADELVLRAAMERTRKKYGPYRYEVVQANIPRDRLLIEMQSGELFNVTVVASQKSWEDALLPVYIPLDMGLSSYRIALTTSAGQARVSAARNLDYLKELRLGVAAGWSSRKAFEGNGFSIVTADNFESVFSMLLADRVDYFPRGVNEVFPEFDARSPGNPDLRVESTFAIQLPLPGYTFVSPTAPRLHQRLQEGLEAMVRDGSMRRIVVDYHADMIRRADFCKRRIFTIGNPAITVTAPLQRKDIWFDPFDPKTGVCPKQKTANEIKRAGIKN